LNYPLYTYASNGFGEVYDVNTPDVFNRMPISANVTSTGVINPYVLIYLVYYFIVLP
jgi:hypothetical protein